MITNPITELNNKLAEANDAAVFWQVCTVFLSFGLMIVGCLASILYFTHATIQSCAGGM